jgi:hypothetical protein
MTAYVTQNSELGRLAVSFVHDVGCKANIVASVILVYGKYKQTIIIGYFKSCCIL